MSHFSGLVVQDHLLVGWILDQQDLSRRFIADIDCEGVPLAVVRSETFLPDLRDRGFGDGCYGFILALDDHLEADRSDVCTYNLRVANADGVIASARRSQLAGLLKRGLGGTVVWRGGGRLSGTLRGRRLGALGGEVEIFEQSRKVDVTISYSPGEDPVNETTFDLFLPSNFADGDLHAVRVIDPNGTELDGSPVWILQERKGFRELTSRMAGQLSSRQAIDERVLELLDRLVPASAPLTFFNEWNESFGTTELRASADERPVTIGVVVVGRLASEATLSSLHGQTAHVMIRAGILDIDASGRFAPEAWLRVQAALTRGGPLDGIIVVRAGSTLAPTACRRIANVLSMDGDFERSRRLCLADHLLFESSGQRTPIFEPAFDYERMLSQGYGEGLFGLPPAMASRMDLGHELSSTYDLLLAAVEASGASDRGSVVHIPEVLASVPQIPIEAAAVLLKIAVERHVARIGVPANVLLRQGEVLPAVYVERPVPTGSVEIIIPTRDRLDLLRPCLDGLLSQTQHRDFRVLVVDNGSTDQGTLHYLEDLVRRKQIRVLRDDRPFNFSRINNRAVQQTEATFVCFLNNDVEIRDGAWLGAMLRHLSRRDVGAVGAKLVWPNQMLQHGGVVLGTGFAASHAFDRYLAAEAGFMDGIRVARECGALTAACLLMRRNDFLDVGGFDETAFPVAFNDVDLCLKLRSAGKVLVWTPEAELLHKESASRGRDHGRASAMSRSDKELAELRRIWRQALVEDPYYNPNLNLDAYSYTGLATPPRDRSPRRNRPPIAEWRRPTHTGTGA